MRGYGLHRIQIATKRYEIFMDKCNNAYSKYLNSTGLNYLSAIEVIVKSFTEKPDAQGYKRNTWDNFPTQSPICHDIYSVGLYTERF